MLDHNGALPRLIDCMPHVRALFASGRYLALSGGVVTLTLRLRGLNPALTSINYLKVPGLPAQTAICR
jgi:hypothetical protein